MHTMEKRPLTALLSVFHKDGITEFASALSELGINLISTGGTYEHLTKANVIVQDVSVYTGFAPMLDHRVATLHPAVFAGLLADPIPEHLAVLEKNKFPWIDILCVDFYPLAQAIEESKAMDPAAGLAYVLKKTDIGGPTMARAAGKTGRLGICDHRDREILLARLRNGTADDPLFRDALRAKAEQTVAEYCRISAEYHAKRIAAELDARKDEGLWPVPFAA